LNKQEIKQQLKEILAEDENTLFAFLFGSLVRGDDIEGSDIDVGIYFKDDSKDLFEEKLRLTNLLIGRIGGDCRCCNLE
jgi:predicted nucleotidyltransferase